MKAVSPRRRLLVLVAIVGTGCIFSSLLLTKISPRLHHHHLRTTHGHDTSTPSRRRLFSFLHVSEPKTVEFKPQHNNGMDDTTSAEAPTAQNRRWYSPAPLVVGDADLYKVPIVKSALSDPLYLHGLDDYTNSDSASSTSIGGGGGGSSISPYFIDNALLTIQGFRYALFFFVYDSPSDQFFIIHNKPKCDLGCSGRINRVGTAVAYALRKNFPERFRGAAGGSDDLVFMMSTGDVPRIKQPCLFGKDDYCRSADYAPILNFGSTFVDTTRILPTAIVMPPSVKPHISCFNEWQQFDMGRYGVCQDLKPKFDLDDMGLHSGLVFGEEMGLLDDEKYWDNLIPQVIWRGTDFVFLHTMFPDMRSPTYELDIAPHEATRPQNVPLENIQRWAIRQLWKMGDEKLLPRWRGVLLTSEAELGARKYNKKTANGGESKLPWINVKFATTHVNGQKVLAAENRELQHLQSLGISAIGEPISMVEQARYRYHVDLGGGGGTTWTGTIEKLALPGVLFHHVTPTKDWFHDLLVPWKHYIPIKTDLSDLREKFDWAESHPAEAKQIAEAGTEFARWIGSTEGFRQLYEEHFVAPLRDVINAYQPMPAKFGRKGALDVINDFGIKEGFTVVGRCSGEQFIDCETFV